MTIKDLIRNAKLDGDTLEVWLSTLPSHLIFLVQSGSFALDKEIAEYVKEGRSLWAETD